MNKDSTHWENCHLNDQSRAWTEIVRLRTKLTECELEREDLHSHKDEAYLERNQCVALIARMAMALGYWAGTARTAIEDWSDDWHGCVYIDLPAGQVSWHYHDSQAHLFDWLPPYCGDWDGHDTPEKYRRVLSRTLMPNARADRLEAAIRDAPHSRLCPAIHCGHVWSDGRWCTREEGSHGSLVHNFFPRGECNCWKRSFENVARHMATKHPDFAASTE